MSCAALFASCACGKHDIIPEGYLRCLCQPWPCRRCDQHPSLERVSTPCTKDRERGSSGGAFASWIRNRAYLSSLACSPRVGDDALGRGRGSSRRAGRGRGSGGVGRVVQERWAHSILRVPSSLHHCKHLAGAIERRGSPGHFLPAAYGKVDITLLLFHRIAPASQLLSNNDLCSRAREGLVTDLARK